MKYLTTNEFAEYMHIAPCTVSKRVSSGTMPQPDKTQRAKRGRPGYLWSQATVDNYKVKLSLRLYRLTSVRYSLRASADKCNIEESQASRLLNDLKNLNTKRVNTYDLFMQTSAQLTNNRGI